MVLRGSKTHPTEADIKAIANAIQYLEESIHNIEDQEVSVEHEILERLQTDFPIKTPQPLSPEMTQSIRVLLERLEYLENTHKKKEIELEEYKKKLKITVGQFICGGMAGIVARSTVAPIDRIKLLIQTAFQRNDKSKSMVETFRSEIKEGGIRSLWKGNFTNCIRVFPYAAIQFGSYERFKSYIIHLTEKNNRNFGFMERLTSGACAGATAATFTYPLDVMRVRIAVYKDLNGPIDAIRDIYREGGMRYFFKGWTPTVMSLAPFIATNFATFDYLKSVFIPDGNIKQASTGLVLGLGAMAGLFAQTVCYPLDTVRRSMQIHGQYNHTWNCFQTIYQNKGFAGFYKGFIPNTLKIVPNNGIRFLVFTKLTTYLGIPTAKSRK